MGNCLVTKLKGVVDNPEFIKLNEVRIDFIETEGMSAEDYSITVKNQNASIARIISGSFSGGGITPVNIPANTDTIITVTPGTSIAIDNKDTMISLYDTQDNWQDKNIKYNLNAINFVGTSSGYIGGKANIGIYGDIYSLSGSGINRIMAKSNKIVGSIEIQLPHCTVFQVNGGGLTGNINNSFLQQTTDKLNRVHLNDSPITGDLETLVVNNDLTELSLKNCTEINEGNLEVFAALLATKGRSKTLSCYLGGTKIKYQNSPVNSRAYKIAPDGTITQ